MEVMEAVPVSPGEEALAPEFRRLTEEPFARLWVDGRGYRLALAATALLFGVGALSWGYQLWAGIGVSGLQHPMMWAVYISSFVWWIGIAHAGTLTSALFYLFRAPFRAAFARSAEAMTLIAIVTSALYPVIHLGRAWRAYWLFPYPNQRQLWVTFTSPLILEVFAILADIGVVLLFFWVGLIPDMALLRDRSKGWRRTFYGLLAVGWEGTARQWRHRTMAYSILAALAVPLIVLVHSVAAWDFALAIVPRWHSTLLAPYFVAGAVFSGLALVLVLLIPLRRLLGLEGYITLRHLDQIARLVLVSSLLLTFAYLVDYWMAWHAPGQYARQDLLNKLTGDWAAPFWAVILLNSVLPLALFWPEVRQNTRWLFLICLLICVGMWLERLVLVAGSLARDYLPYAWAPEIYQVSLTEAGIFLGSLGWFGLCFLLFVRYFPVVPFAELKREALQQFREERARAWSGREDRGRVV